MPTQIKSSSGPAGTTETILEPIRQPSGFGSPASAPGVPRPSSSHMAGFGTTPAPTPKMPAATRNERATR